MPSKSKTPPHLNNQNPHKTYPPKSKDPYPHPPTTTTKPQETQPANISSVRKAPDPGRLLTKDPHPLPGGCLLPSLAPRCSARSGCTPSPFARPPLPAPSPRFPLRSHLRAGNPPATSCSRVRPRSLAQLPLSSPVGSPAPPGQTDQNYPLSPHTQNTPKMPLPATIHVLNVYE